MAQSNVTVSTELSDPLPVAPQPFRQRAVDAARALLAKPIIRSGLSMAGSSVVSSSLGLLFWILAARRFSPADVGVSSTIIMTMIAMSDLCHLGLRTGILRYVPLAGVRRWGLIWRAYGVAMAAAAVAASVFVLGLGWWMPELLVLRSWFYGPLFVATTACWVVFQMEDSSLLALRLAHWIPVENGIFGLVKVLLLLPVAALALGDSRLGVFLAWAVPVFPVVVLVNVAVRAAVRRQNLAAAAAGVAPAAAGPSAPSPRRALRGTFDAGALGVPARELLSFSLADWSATASRTALTGLLSLLVLAYEGPEASAYYGVAATIALSLQLISVHIGDALLTESSHDRDAVDRNTLHSGLLGIAISAPVVLVATILAPVVLSLFGAEYPAGASTVLRLLLIACLPNVVTRIYVGRLRADRRIKAVIGFELALAVAELAGGWLLLLMTGIGGVGVAVLVATTLGAFYVLTVESSAWWWSRLPPVWRRRLNAVAAAGQKVVGLRRRGELSRAVNAALATRYRTVPTWRRAVLTPHLQSVAVAGHEGRPPLRLELASTDWGADVLARRAAASTAIAALSDLSSFRALIPYTIDDQSRGEGRFLLESALSGRPGSDLGRNQEVLPLVEAVHRAMDELHRATPGWITFGPDELEHWVSQPIRRLSDNLSLEPGSLVGLGRFLCDELRGRRVPAARIHGNLGLSTALFDPSGRLTGIVDWEWSDRGPAFLDWCTLALSAQVVELRTELGAIVRDLLEDPEVFTSHQSLARRSLPDVQAPVLILLAWLHLLVPAVTASSAPARGLPVHTEAVEPVLAWLAGREVAAR